MADCSSRGRSEGGAELGDDLLEIPAAQVDFLLVHELVYVKIPEHGKGFQVTMDYTLPDWHERELLLAAWMFRNR